MTHHLFSEEACPERSRRELFLNISLNQANQFAQVTKSIVLKVIMQNKPNLCVFWAVNGDCEEKQTQTNPIQTQNKAIFCTKNPPQSQNKPNSNPIYAGQATQKFTRHSFSEGGPPAELRNSARQKKMKTISLNKNQLANQKYPEKEMTLYPVRLNND